MSRLLAKPWLAPLLYTLREAGGCIELSRLSIGRLRRRRLRSLVWGARGLVHVEEGRVCLTQEGAKEASRLRLAGSRGSWLLYMYSDTTAILVNLKPTRVTAYVVPHHLLERALKEGATGKDELTRRLAIHPKTASILARALAILEGSGQRLKPPKPNSDHNNTEPPGQEVPP